MPKPAYKELSEKIEKECLTDSNAVYIKSLANDGSVNEYTYGSVLVSFNIVRFFLEGLGCREHDRVVLLLPYSPAAVITLTGLFYADAIAVPIDYSLPPAEIQRLIEEIDAAAIITDQAMLDKFDESFTRNYPFLVKREQPTIEDDCVDFELAPQGLKKARVCDVYDNDPDIVAILFSSGTTSRTKAVCMRPKTLIEMADNHEKYVHLPRKRTGATVFPHFHLAGLIVIYVQLFSHTVVYMNEEFNVVKFPELLTTFEPECISVIPSVLDAYRAKILGAIESKGSAVEAGFKGLLATSLAIRKKTGANVGNRIFKSIREQAFGKNLYILYYGGEGIKKETYDFFYALGIESMINNYASTEVPYPCVQSSATDGYLGSAVGKYDTSKDAGVQVVIKDEDQNAIGEVRVSSPFLFKSYFRDPELTRHAFDDNGFFKTGDLGYFDKTGSLFIVGRKKDIILMRNGKKVSPDDLEDYYKKACDLKELAVCGIANKDGFDEIVLFIMRDPGSNESPDACRNRLNEAISKDSMLYLPSAIEFVDSIPRTAAGKTKRYLLRERYEQIVKDRSDGIDQALSREIDHASESVEAILAEISNVPLEDIKDDSELARDLGIDSLSMFELQARIAAEYGVDIGNQMIKVSTVSDLKRALADSEISGDSQTNDQIQVGIDYSEYPKERTASDFKFLSVILKAYSTLYKHAIHAARKTYDVKPCIVVANHLSYYDGSTLYHALQELGFQPDKMAYLMATNRLYDRKLRRRVTHAMGCVPIDRYSNPKPGYDALERCLENGYSIVLHPEGVLSQDGTMGEFKNGAFKLAIDNQVPILPVRIEGTSAILRYDLRGSNLPKLLNKGRRFNVTVHVGDYLYPDTSDPSELAARARKAIEAL